MMKYDYVTFDCYGTLIDWEQGIGDAFVQAASADGVVLQRADALSAYMRFEPIVEAGPYRSYRDVLRETAQRVAERFDWDLDEARADFLPRSLANWPAFEDTHPALERLRAAGYRLGILSNVDVDLLAATLRRLDTEFDLLVTAQQVGDYKPNHAHFLEARQRIGNARWLHAAQSYFHGPTGSFARSRNSPTGWWVSDGGRGTDGGRPPLGPSARRSRRGGTDSGLSARFPQRPDQRQRPAPKDEADQADSVPQPGRP
jgi:2-haloalkanoic acid dehalogenase type II